MLSEVIKQRVKRHKSFIHPFNGSSCFYPKPFLHDVKFLCSYIKAHEACNYYVYFIDYLRFNICTLQWMFHSTMIMFVLIYAAALFSLLYLLTKYFCLPNFMCLLHSMPISRFACSYVFFGCIFFAPRYVTILFTGPRRSNDLFSLSLSLTVADVFRYYIIGAMALSFNGHRVNGIVLWSTTSFLVLGYTYLIWLVQLKYMLFGRTHLPYNDTHMLTTNAWGFLVIFVLIMILVIIISYHNQQLKTMQLEERSSQLSIVSGFSVAGDGLSLSSRMSRLVRLKRLKRKVELSPFVIWWGAVNSVAILAEEHIFFRIIFVPLHFVLAHLIPVTDMDRPMRGWCKPIACSSIFFFPFLFLGLKPNLQSWYTVLVCSWLFIFLVAISTHSQREPGTPSLIVYSMGAISMYSILIRVICLELNNLFWQYFSFRFNTGPDLKVIFLFGYGESFCIALMLVYLIRQQSNNAAFGVTMSVITYSIYMALPLSIFSRDYDFNTYIIFTAHTHTVHTFFLVTIYSTLIFISMSGYEFRMTLFIYHVGIIMVYLMYQAMVFCDFIHPFGPMHKIDALTHAIGLWV